MVKGKRFLEKLTRKTAVIVLTEQTQTTFAVALKRAGLESCQDLHVLFHHSTFGMNWPAVVKMTIEYARERGAEFLVIDTLGQWVGLKEADENQSGPAMEALKPLQIAAGLGFGVLVIRHDRKAGGAVGDSARGSSAFGGGVDTILRLSRPEGRSSPTVRVIEGISRFDGVPDEVAIDFTNGEYTLLGDVAQLGRRQAREAVLTHLPTSVEKAISTSDLIENTNGSRTYITQTVKSLFDEGWIQRVGTGGRNNAYRYWIDAETRDDLLEEGGDM